MFCKALHVYISDLKYCVISVYRNNDFPLQLKQLVDILQFYPLINNALPICEAPYGNINKTFASSKRKLIQLCVNWAWIVVKSPLSANDKPVARAIQEYVSREVISRDW